MGAEAMSSHAQDTIAAPVLKVGSAWGLAALTWSEIAAMIAAGYTLCLWGEWLWKKVVRPYCESRGWIQRKKRRKADYTDV